MLALLAQGLVTLAALFLVSAHGPLGLGEDSKERPFVLAAIGLWWARILARALAASIDASSSLG